MLKKKDLLILSHLRRNARDSLVNIAKNTNTPVSTVYDKLRGFETTVIKKHSALIDFPKMGFSIRTVMLLNSINPSKVVTFIGSNNNINSAYAVDGSNDFWIDCVFMNMGEMQAFLDKLAIIGVSKKEVNFVTNELKRESFLDNQKYLNKLMEVK